MSSRRRSRSRSKSRSRSREDRGRGGSDLSNKRPPNIHGMCSLKVDNLSYRVTPEDLKPVFERYGDVGDVYIPRDRFTKDSRGFAFVRFYDRRDAEDAMDRMDGYVLDGREMRVQLARYGRPAEPPQIRYGRNYIPPSRDSKGGRSRNSRSRSRSGSPRRRRSHSRSPKRRSRYSSSRSRSRSASPHERKSKRRSRSPSRSRSHSRSRSPSQGNGGRRSGSPSKDPLPRRDEKSNSPEPQRSPTP